MCCRRLTAAACLAMLALIACVAWSPADDKGDGWTQLFNGKDLTGWKTFVDPKKPVEPDKVCSVKDGDKIKLVVNGELQNEASGAEATRGKILLQSEGAEIHFRNVALKPLK